MALLLGGAVERGVRESLDRLVTAAEHWVAR